MSSRITRRRGGTAVRLLAALLLAPLVLAPAALAAEGEGHGGAEQVNWQGWKANNQIGDQASLQRGAANFANYCAGCHSLKYMRYERMAKDLGIPDDLLRKNLLPEGAKPTDYMLAHFPQAEAQEWFGRVPPDLSLITRAKGSDYVYRFLKTFYVDDKTVNGTNNLALPGTAMPHVLSALQGAQALKTAQKGGHEHFEGFEQLEPGQLTAAQYDEFVRDTVNFLDYVGEPAKLHRTSIGIWVILFLLLFTAFAYLLKQEYWKDVK